MRLALFSALLLFGACAPTTPSPGRLVALADALSAEEYADTFLDELEDRLDEADQDLTRQQHRALKPVLVDGAEAQRTLIRANAASPSETFADDSAALTSRTDAAAEAILTPQQVPVYRTLRAEARALLRQQVEG